MSKEKNVKKTKVMVGRYRGTTKLKIIEKYNFIKK